MVHCFRFPSLVAALNILWVLFIQCHSCIFQALSDYSTVLLLQESPKYSYKVYVNRGLLYLQLKDFANALLDFMEAERLWAKEGEREGEMKGDPAIHQVIGYCHHQWVNWWSFSWAECCALSVSKAWFPWPGHWGILKGHSTGSIIPRGLCWSRQCLHGLPHRRRLHQEQVCECKEPSVAM